MSEPILHVYVAAVVPATDPHEHPADPHEQMPGWPPRALIRCHRCNRLRQARNIVAQHYYDGSHYWCADKTQCRKPKKGRRK